MTLKLILFSGDIICFTVNLILVGLLWFADKHTRQLKALVLMGVTTCYWLILDSIAMIAQPEAHGYMYILRSIMVAVSPYYFLYFVLSLNNLSYNEKPWLNGILTLVPTADVLLLLTNPLHRLIFAADGFPLPAYGPLFPVHCLVAYAPIAAGLFFLYKYIIKTRPPRWFTWTCALASTAAIVLNVLFTLGIVSLPQDVAPFAFFIMFCAFTAYAFRTRVGHFKAHALADIFESYSDAVFIVDEDGIISDFNAAAQRFFPKLLLTPGRSRLTELIAYFRRVATALTPDTLFEGIGNPEISYGGGEFALKGAEGKLKTLRVARQAVSARRGVSGLLITLSDITAYRDMIAAINDQNTKLTELKDMAESASEAKTTFLANMSHEMRTPLNAILGLSEVELRKESPPKTRENIEKIYVAGRNLLSVINDILDISKIESGQFELVPCAYDTPSMINDTVNVNIIRIREKAVRFHLELDDNLPSRLYGDELRVKQVLNNLLSNAFKYTKEGTVTLSIRHRMEGGDAILALRVADTGIGIRREDMPALFRDYNQVDVRINHNIEGTGLGLSITKRLTEMMDGKIQVESEYGKGSVFTATIRQRVEDVTPIGPETAARLARFEYTAGRLDRQKETIAIEPMPYATALLVDDLEINLEVAEVMMSPYQLAIDTALSGYEAVEKVRRETPRYDIIFMDHMMPGMDGVEAVRAIRREIGTDYAREVPIVALTANALTGNEEMFLESGFQDYLSKPIDTKELDRILHKWVAGPRKAAGQGG